MEFLLEISGQHPGLAKAEINAVLEGEGKECALEEVGVRTYLIETDLPAERLIPRLAFTKKAGKVIAKEKDLKGLAEKIGRLEGTFAVSGREDLRYALGERLCALGNRVRLENPDFRIICLEKEGDFIAAEEIQVGEGFEGRKPQDRPYFHPTSMDPRIARALVNLSRVKPGDRVLDPFCGTGGILIEAGLMGINVSGVDYDPAGAQGCEENLRFYSLSGDIRQGDALEIRLKEKVDSIVTDPPYGRSSQVTDRNLDRFYERFVSKAEESLKEKGFLVVVLPDSATLRPGNLKLREEHSIYVHKSLTRKIYVLEKA